MIREDDCNPNYSAPTGLVAAEARRASIGTHGLPPSLVALLEIYGILAIRPL